MIRKHVSSSAIVSVGYEQNTHQLEVEFRDGAVYKYYGVPPYVYFGLIQASSPGNYFNHVIKKEEYTFIIKN